MAGDVPGRSQDLTESSATFPSDSENYSSGNNDLSPSPPSSSSSPLILYSPPTIWGLLRGAAINLLLPFVNGLMLGFGELFAHEAAFRLGWSGTKVQPHLWNPSRRKLCSKTLSHCRTTICPLSNMQSLYQSHGCWANSAWRTIGIPSRTNSQTNRPRYWDKRRSC